MQVKEKTAEVLGVRIVPVRDMDEIASYRMPDGSHIHRLYVRGQNNWWQVGADEKYKHKTLISAVGAWKRKTTNERLVKEQIG